MLAMVLLTNNILDKCTEKNKFVCQNSMQSMPTLTSPEKIHCHTEGLTGSAFTSLCQLINVKILTHQQLVYIYKSSVSQKLAYYMLQNVVSRGANVPPLMCNWFEGSTG